MKMLTKSIIYFVRRAHLSLRILTAVILLFFSFCVFTVSCIKKIEAPPIGDNISFPSKLLTVSDNEFLLLNSNGANRYEDGSIQRYVIDFTGSAVLTKSFSVETHALDIALSNDLRLLALSFDGSKEDTNILFYDYSTNTELKPLAHLKLQFVPTGSKQSIKQINFFQVEGYEDYFLSGVILTSALDTGDGKYIPARTFVAKISADLSSAQVLFVLSYGLGDDKNGTQTLAPKSDSLRTGFKTDVVQYMLGSTAPLYDPAHSLFIAFPTGSMNGFNDTYLNVVPKLPSALEYFSAQQNPIGPCPSNEPNCTKPDLRAVSIFAVDMKSFLNNTPLNLALYYVPLAWNSNGIPFGHKTNNTVITLGAGTSDDITTFSFQSDFWSAHLIDANTLLVGKKDGDPEDETGKGNEVFQITGLDILAENITKINEQSVLNPEDSKDFKLIANRQILDSYHMLNAPMLSVAGHGEQQEYSNTAPLSSNWPVNPITQIRNPNPMVPYMYSRTVTDEGKGAFINAPTAVYNFDTVCADNTNPSTCFPYWIRATYVGLGRPGRDSSWLTTNIPSPSYHLGDSPVFQDAPSDPSFITKYPFKELSGAQVCTTLQKQDVYCVSFLTSEFTKYHFSASLGFIPF